MSGNSYAATRGVVFVHSAAAALCPHIGWALEGVLGRNLTLQWTTQGALPGSMRAELTWIGPAGTGARLASALRGWDGVRYEVTEDPSLGSDGSRWSYTPRLGLHHASTSANGDIVVNENQMREVIKLAQGSPDAMEEMIDELLGGEWDEELEIFRRGGEASPVRWLHKVG